MELLDRAQNPTPHTHTPQTPHNAADCGPRLVGGTGAQKVLAGLISVGGPRFVASVMPPPPPRFSLPLRFPLPPTIHLSPEHGRPSPPGRSLPSPRRGPALSFPSSRGCAASTAKLILNVSSQLSKPLSNYRNRGFQKQREGLLSSGCLLYMRLMKNK